MTLLHLKWIFSDIPQFIQLPLISFISCSLGFFWEISKGTHDTRKRKRDCRRGYKWGLKIARGSRHEGKRGSTKIHFVQNCHNSI